MTNNVAGILWIYFANAFVLTVPVSLILLVLYRRTLARGMRASNPLPRVVDQPPAGARVTPDCTGSGARGMLEPRARRSVAVDESRARLRLAVIYVGAGMLGAAVLTFFRFSGDLEFNALSGFVNWYVFCWPIVPTVAVLLVLPRKQAISLFLAYLVLGLMIILLWSELGHLVLGRHGVKPISNARQFVSLMALVAGFPFLVILISGNRRVRSVAPLVIAGLLIFSFSTFMALRAFVAIMDLPSLRGWVLNLAGAGAWPFAFMVFSVPIGFACWVCLRWLSGRFESKAFSDVQLLVDTWWIIVVFQQAVDLSNRKGWGGLIALLAFVAYRLFVVLASSLWTVKAAAAPGNRLLLLRVFGFQRRSERLFDSLAQRWRFTGSILMIAGTDLALRTINPGQFVSFLCGRLKQRFVTSSADLVERLNRIDDLRDPDGRFRVNEFFCLDYAWRPALQALLERSDLVLMDLRGFSEKNRGCRFELEQIRDLGLLERTLFLVDETTETEQLATVIDERSRGVPTPAGVFPPHRISLPQRKFQASLVPQILAALRNLAAPALGGSAAESKRQYT